MSKIEKLIIKYEDGSEEVVDHIVATSGTQSISPIYTAGCSVAVFIQRDISESYVGRLGTKDSFIFTVNKQITSDNPSKQRKEIEGE